MASDIRRRSSVTVGSGLLLAGLFFGGANAARAGESMQRANGPMELDRIVSRVNGRIITQSDIREARVSRLVDDTTSDLAARRALENRWLILAEVARAAPLPPPTDAELSLRRSEWQGTSGGRSTMSEAEIQLWLRDDLRIRAYLARQFGMLPEVDRSRARDEWIARLRQRAELD